jgi:hypothetical protein
MTLPTVPPLDHMLIWQAETKATGANIHRVVSALGKYKNQHHLCERALERGDDITERVEKLADFERRLRLTLRNL